VYPQEGPSGLPLIEYSSLEKPFSRTIMISVARDVMIDGWVRG
jgi:hypothetical protein